MMAPHRRSSFAALLLIVMGSIVVSQPFEHVSAHPDDIVEMSPGMYAGTLGTRARVVKLEYPKSTIIENATGDFSFRLTLDSNASSVAILVPPEFDFLGSDTTSIWTSITNDYRQISLRKLGSTDAIGPLWWKVAVTNLTIPAGTYVVRMFNIRAPDVCGRYFMKVFIGGESIGSENFPTIVVKGSLDPAYVSGRVLNGDPANYGLPVNASGKVIAEGKTATGRTVKGQAYFNASSDGAYTLYGLAAGTYSLTASAAGFAPTTMTEKISANPGQSLEGIDIYVYPSATISATIWSKSICGPIPWGYVYNWTLGQTPRPISVEILDSNATGIALITNRTDPTLAFYHFSFNGSLELDGHVPQDYAGYVSGLETGDYYLKVFVNGYIQKDVIAVHVQDHLRSVSVLIDLWRSSWLSVTVYFTDYEGGPPSPVEKSGQLRLEAYSLDGTLQGSNTTLVPAGSTNWTAAITGILGRMTDYGLPGGTYFIEASFPGYLQTNFVRATVGEGCSVTVISFPIARGGVLEVVLRSVNWQMPPQAVPWRYGNATIGVEAATIRVEAISSQGEVYVGTTKQELYAGPNVPAFANVTAVAKVTGLPSDIYLVRAYTTGYIQTRDYFVAVSPGSLSDIMIDLVQTTRIEVTLTFRSERRIAPIDTYPYDPDHVPVRIELYDSMGVLTGANMTHVDVDFNRDATIEVVGFRSYAGNPCLRWVNYYDTTDGQAQKDYGLPPGEYLVRVWVPGYHQSETMTVSTALHVSLVGAALSLERLAHVFGRVYGLNMYQDLLPLSWATITAYGPTLEATYSADGFYEMWLMDGIYILAAASAGYETEATEIYVSSGWETPVDFELSA